MKKNKTAYFTSILFLCIIAAFFVSVCICFIRIQLGISSGNTVQSDTGASEGEYAPSIDWKQNYPFDENKHFVSVEIVDEEQAAESEKQDAVSCYVAAIKKIEDKIDYYTTKLLPGRMKFVEANAFFNKSVGMKIISGTDSVVAMKNGYLTFETGETDTTQAVQSLKWFSDIAKQKGIDFLYIQYPVKEQSGNDQLPNGVHDNANKNADKLLKGLDENDVNYIDVRTLLSQKDNDWYSNFFKTDHHWKPETGVWASGKIIDFINANFGYKLAAIDSEDYKTDVYEKYCFGSQGRIASLTYAEPEDISLIYPENDTSFTVCYNTDGPVTGRFEDVFFDKSNLSNTDYYNHSAYSTYLHGNKALTTIKNNNCKNGKRILVIGDSFNKTVVPYLAQAVENIDLLDRRYFNGSVISYIEKNSPDAVLIAYTPTLIGNALTHSSTFNFE